jgi:hypothetical protein
MQPVPFASMTSSSQEGRLLLKWSANNRVHSHVYLCAAAECRGERAKALSQLDGNVFVAPKEECRVTVYVFTNQEKSDDGKIVVGCCIGSTVFTIEPKQNSIAQTSKEQLQCGVVCKTTNQTFHQGEVTAYSDEFCFKRAPPIATGANTEFNEFVSKELHCFGLARYSPYKIDFLSVVDQTSCEPIACVDHLEKNGDDDDAVFSMVGYDGSRTLSEWSTYFDSELGLYQHPVLFKAAVPIVERVHLTEWTPLQHSMPAAMFFTQFADAAPLKEGHLLATLQIALERNGMSADRFVRAVEDQKSMSKGVLRDFNSAVSVCAESATVLPNAFHYRTDSTRDPRTGKLVMMDKMERLNGWVKRSYGDCEDMAAYMTQHLHTLRESDDLQHPVTRAAHELMQSYMPIATLGSVTYVGAGGAKLADNEYKATDTMYSDGNAAHMWTMMVPHVDVMRMLNEDIDTFAAWESQLSLRVCEGTSRMAPNVLPSNHPPASIKSLYANHHHSEMDVKNKARRALQVSGVQQMGSQAHVELDHTTKQHPFYKRPTHAFTPSLQSNPKYTNVMQFVFCKENGDDELEYSMPFDSLLRKNACYKLQPVPVCGASIKKRLASKVLQQLPLCTAMDAHTRTQDNQVAQVDTISNARHVSSATYQHNIWTRGNHMEKLDTIMQSFASQHVNNSKRLSVRASLESLGVDAPLVTRFSFSSQDII